MARFPEQRLWDRIRANLGMEIHIERIENAVAAGTPDTLVIHRGWVTFIEHKTAELPVKKTSMLRWRHPLTADQRNWHMVWFQNGGRSFIVVSIGQTLHAIPGYLVDKVNAMTPEDIAPWLVNMKQLSDIYKDRGR